MIEIRCRGCGKTYRAPERLAGKKIRCRQCSAVVEVPAALPVLEATPIHEDPEVPEGVAADAPGADTPPPLSRAPAPKKGRAPRTPPAPAAAAPEYEFRGSGSELLVLHIARLMVFLVLVFAVLFAVGLSFADQQRVEIPFPEVDPLLGWIVVVGVFVIYRVVAKAVGLYRVRHTYVFGAPLDHRPGCLAEVGHTLLNVLLFCVTLGLAGPWIIARNLRFFYRSCVVPARAGQHLDFRGAGLEVLGYVLLGVVSLPLVILTFGIFGVVLSWMWVRWEQSKLWIPDPTGTWRETRFNGTLGDYLGQSIVGWLLTMITLGFYRSWALVACWTWIASRTEVLEPNESLSQDA